tara:strand:- start:486 stop:677 length:192 start_codon:yes stop_codon:yes gene_type:complete
MKLTEVDFYMDWPVAIKVKNLRQYLMANIVKKGDLIRWSIVEIKNSIDSYGTKKLRIKAVLAN